MLFNILITKDIAQCVSVLTYMHVCYGPVALNENKIIVYCIYITKTSYKIKHLCVQNLRVGKMCNPHPHPHPR